MPHITLEMLPGRSEETKQKLAEELSKVLITYGNAVMENISITIKDIPQEEWKAVYDRFMDEEETLYQKPGYTA